MTKTLHAAAGAAVFYALLSGSGMAAEFTGKSTFWYAYRPQSSLQLTPERFTHLGVVDGTNTFETSDGSLAGIARRCVAIGNGDGTSSGYCQMIDLDGDRWSETYGCDAVVEPRAGVGFACTGVTEVIADSGTGKYQKMAGKSTFIEEVRGALPEGAIVGSVVFDYELSY